MTATKWNRVRCLCQSTLLLFVASTLPIKAVHCQVATTAVDTPSAVTPLTLHNTGRPLTEVLKEVSRSSGQNLKALRDVENVRISVYTRERPSNRVLEDIAHLLNTRWQRTPAGDGFQLVQEADQRQFERRLYRAMLERAASPVRQFARNARTSPSVWKAFLEQRVSVKPPDISEREKRDVWEMQRNTLAYLIKPEQHAGAALLDTLALDQMLDFVREGTLSISWDHLTSRQQELARVMRTRDDRWDDRDFKLPEDKAREEDAKDLIWMKRFGLIFQADTEPMSGEVRHVSIGIAASSVSSYGFPKREEDRVANLLPVRGRPYTLFDKEASKAKEEYAELEKQPFPSGVVLPAGALWGDVLAKLVTYLSLPIYSDDYTAARCLARMEGGWHRVPVPSPPEGLEKMTLVEGLDALCRVYGYLWWYENGALFFRTRTWPIEQEYETSPSVLKQLTPSRSGDKKREVMASEVLVTLSSLTVKQLKGLTARTFLSPSATTITQFVSGPSEISLSSFHAESSLGRVEATKQVLRLFARLTLEQRKIAQSPEGISFAQLDATQQSFLLQAAFRLNLGRVADDPTQMTMHIDVPYVFFPTQNNEPVIGQCHWSGIRAGGNNYGSVFLFAGETPQGNGPK